MRDVTIHRLEQVDWQPPSLTVAVECSKGTYVRALARDLGEALGTAGTLWQLRRTRSGPFGVDQALSLEQVQNDPDAAAAALLPPEAMVAELPRFTASGEQTVALSQGRALPLPATVTAGDWAVFTEDGPLLGIARADEDHLRPHKVLLPADAAPAPSFTPHGNCVRKSDP